MLCEVYLSVSLKPNHRFWGSSSPHNFKSCTKFEMSSSAPSPLNASPCLARKTTLDKNLQQTLLAVFFLSVAGGKRCTNILYQQPTVMLFCKQVIFKCNCTIFPVFESTMNQFCFSPSLYTSWPLCNMAKNYIS